MRYVSVVFSCVIIFTLKVKGGKCETSSTSNQIDLKTHVDGNEEGCICTMQYDPVCGSDGKTYGNACALGCTRKENPYVFGLCKGECPCCKEPFYNDPLALIEETGFFGWDLMKHSVESPNPLIFSSPPQPQKPDTEAEKSFCNIEPAYHPNCICPYIYKPVCGSDGHTYSNSCLLGCSQKVNPCVKQACEGKCPCCACPVTIPM